MSEQENILVFNSSVLDECNPIEGFQADASHYGGQIFIDSADKPFFRNRAECETDESVKQIIPYIVIRLNTDGQNKYLVYQRSKKGGESRLMGKHSVGIGGHVNDQDSHIPFEAFMACIRREIKEELEIEVYPDILFSGVIYDPSDAVGRVHFGFVVQVIAKNGTVKAREEAIFDPHFVAVRDLLQMRDQLEPWSRIVLDSLLATQ